MSPDAGTFVKTPLTRHKTISKKVKVKREFLRGECAMYLDKKYYRVIEQSGYHFLYCLTEEGEWEELKRISPKRVMYINREPTYLDEYEIEQFRVELKLEGISRL